MIGVLLIKSIEALIITTQHADQNNEACKFSQLFHVPSMFLIVLQK